MKYSLCITLLMTLALGSVLAVDSIPENLGLGLKELATLDAQDKAALAARIKELKYAQFDSNGRIAVNIHLDGSLSLSELKKAASTLGAEVIAENSDYRLGLFSAWIPLASAVKLATAKGISHVMLAPRAHSFAGKTTAQSASVHRTDVVNNTLGYKGSGITVGVLSDSYGLTTAVTPAQDVASGDLPSNVVVLKDSTKTLGGTDEGRAMMQIVYDLAPQSKLCFATANPTNVAFANNIRSLRTDSRALCDIIVDDIIYLNEPMFSDGIVAKAVDDVVTSTTLAGKKVVYFSAAGNNGAEGYSATFKPVTSTTLATTGQNIKLTSVPSTLYAGGLHNFSTVSGQTDVTQKITLSAGGTLVFQWNDPFDLTNGVTTDYNLLVFDANGNYQSTVSGKDNNFTTKEPIESITLKAGTYQLVIARTSSGTKLASQLRYVVFPNGDYTAEYSDTKTPTTYGHCCSANCIGVAAYVYDSNTASAGNTPQIESFTSNGPVTIYFDSNGNRLTAPVTRQQPAIAAAEGVNTTFFPSLDKSNDYDGDGFPNFFGTSAAAPAAAGVAALVMQASGGPNSITSARMLQVMQGSPTGPRDLDPRICKAVIALPGGSLTVTATGDGATDPNFFNVKLITTKAGASLSTFSLNVAPANLELDPSTTNGQPFILGNLTGLSSANITSSLAQTTTTGAFQILTVNIANNDFVTGDSLSFGIDRDTANVGSGGNSADLLQGATISATISGIGSGTGTFSNVTGTGYNYADGYGLVDAYNAVKTVKP